MQNNSDNTDVTPINITPDDVTNAYDITSDIAKIDNMTSFIDNMLDVIQNLDINSQDYNNQIAILNQGYKYGVIMAANTHAKCRLLNI